MTKGDNNALDDRSLYPPGQDYLYRREIIGSVRGYVPYVGHVSLVLQTLGKNGQDFLFGAGKHLLRRLGKYGMPSHV
jgi:signal peptidase